MDAADKVGAKRFVHGAVAGHARHRLENGSTDRHVEMRLTCTIIACVACVIVAVIHHIQLVWRKGLGQFAFNLVCDTHIYVNPLLSHGQ